MTRPTLDPHRQHLCHKLLDKPDPHQRYPYAPLGCPVSTAARRGKPSVKHIVRTICLCEDAMSVRDHRSLVLRGVQARLCVLSTLRSYAPAEEHTPAKRGDSRPSLIQQTTMNAHRPRNRSLALYVTAELCDGTQNENKTRSAWWALTY